MTTSPKILSQETAREVRERLRSEGKTAVFTNGCFDILHPGHLDFLTFAREQGDVLIVGLNSDSSVRRNKGKTRPIVNETDRARMLAALEVVSYVVVFDEDEPADLIAKLIPDVLVKGEDWQHYVSGREIVESNGGRVVLVPLTKGYSTSGVVKQIRETA